MEKRKIYLIEIGAIIVLIVVITLLFSFFQKEVKIVTEKKEYIRGESLKVKIENRLRENNICYSSCYPYYLERKNEEKWESYFYSKCKDSDLVKDCLAPGQVKAFELILPSLLNEEIHRLVLPACIGCVVQGAFREDKRFYSNEFIVK
jgi:hypothetical protein